MPKLVAVITLKIVIVLGFRGFIFLLYIDFVIAKVEFYEVEILFSRDLVIISTLLLSYL